ncbi:MAG: hypothetical protein ACXWV2_04215 [Chitinophagaceae bacterium]
MKPKPLSAWLLMMLISTVTVAQEQAVTVNKRKLNDLSIAFTNSQTAMPFGKFYKLFAGNYHPGIEVSTGFAWKIKPRHDWIQSFSLGYSYHRWVQHSIVLYTELGYRYKFPAGFSMETRLGAGYMRAILATEAFSDGVEDGKQYSKITSGRSQGIASLSFGINKKIKKPFDCTFFLHYQQRIQTPFIQSYVPLLPYNIIKTGVTIPLNNNH